MQRPRKIFLSQRPRPIGRPHMGKKLRRGAGIKLAAANAKPGVMTKLGEMGSVVKQHPERVHDNDSIHVQHLLANEKGIEHAVARNHDLGPQCDRLLARLKKTRLDRCRVGFELEE